MGYDGQDEFTAVCAAFEHMQQHLLQEREKNAAYERARTDLVAGISHDLRTPLTSVKGYIKGLRDGVANTPAKQAQYLDIAYRKACDMDVLLQRLFYFSKLETGNLPLFPVRADLGEFVRGFVRDTAGDLEQRGGKFLVKGAPAPHLVRIDTEQMYRVLTNLTDNAVRYTGAEFLVLTLTSLNSSGAGISPGVENLERAAVWGSISSNTSSRPTAGPSPPETTAVWSSTLPCPAKRRKSPMPNILIVEDDLEIAMLEQDYLEIEGFQTQTVSDGERAVSAALTRTFDLILLDLMLPGCNGYDVCRRIRDQVDVPILMVTARTDSVDKIRGLGLGADDYIAKPFDPAELVARVKAHLNRYARLTGGVGKKADDDALTVGDLQIFPRSWKVYKAGRELKMPNREFMLLKFLAENPNIVFSKEHLFETIWGYDYVGDSATVTVHIGRIREKIEDDPTHPKIIETVWGAGYRLNA